MSEIEGTPIEHSTVVDGIPLLWLQPDNKQDVHRLAIFLTGFSAAKETVRPHLKDLAADGLTAITFDLWQHGARGTESTQDLRSRVYSNFRRHMWPILGQSVLDVLRIVDWALLTFNVDDHISIGGISLGGDISVAAAGLDHRIDRVAAIVSTPDWLRPGMTEPSGFTAPWDPGRPDSYAQYFYEALNPLTHLDRYAHSPQITFECGARDTLVPPDGAYRFRDGVVAKYSAAECAIRINLHDGYGHDAWRNASVWENARAWMICR